jgi:hypothetical protein
MAASAADTVLSAVHHTIHTTCMPLYTDLLTICKRGYTQTRAIQRSFARYLAHTSL